MLKLIVRSGRFAVVLTALLVPASFANVLVVDAGGGGSYTQIQAAVDAAVDGDTILVKSGAYNSFVVADKALAIVGDAGANVQVLGAASVQSLSAQNTLVLENVTANGITGGSSTAVYGLYLANCAGHVRVENCQFRGASVSAGDGFDGVSINACVDASLTRVTSVGGVGPESASVDLHYTGGAGLRATNSTVTSYQSTLRGGNGADAFFYINGGSGGDGCSASGSVLVLSGLSCFGGNGGRAGFPGLDGAFGGDGGDGIRLTGSNASYLLEAVEVGGNAGLWNPNDPNNTNPGNPGVARAGTTFVDWNGTSHRMHSPTPVRENTSYQLTFTGVPGEQVALVVSNDADYALKLPWKGVMLLKAMHPLLSIPIGTIPQGGTLSVPWTALDLGGLPSKVLHLQPVFVAPQGARTIGNPSTTVILSHLF